MENSLTLTINDATRALGIGRTHLYRLIGEGKVETVQLGRRRLVKTASLRSLIDAEQQPYYSAVLKATGNRHKRARSIPEHSAKK